MKFRPLQCLQGKIHQTLRLEILIWQYWCYTVLGLSRHTNTHKWYTGKSLTMQIKNKWGHEGDSASGKREGKKIRDESHQLCKN